MRFLRIKKSKEEKCEACENHMTFVSRRWQRPASEPRLGNTGVIRVQGPRPPGSGSGGCECPGTRVTLCPHGRHRTRGWGRWPRHARGGGVGEPLGQPRRRISRPGRVSGRRVVSAAGRGAGPRAVRGEWTPPPCPRGPPARALRATEAEPPCHAGPRPLPRRPARHELSRCRASGAEQGVGRADVHGGRLYPARPRASAGAAGESAPPSPQ